jgi:hypothetical protein
MKTFIDVSKERVTFNLRDRGKPKKKNKQTVFEFDLFFDPLDASSLRSSETSIVIFYGCVTYIRGLDLDKLDLLTLYTHNSFIETVVLRLLLAYYAAGMCLQSRCLALDACSGSIIPAFRRHVTIFSRVWSVTAEGFWNGNWIS